MSKPLLALCGIPKVATRDGYSGANAHFYLPFYEVSAGQWFASGQIYTFPGSTIGQDLQITNSGANKPNTFIKDCCSCIDG